jgi:hypothetical protein
MSKIKLKTVHTYKAHQRNILPYVGLVEFDENGHIEVDETQGKLLIELMPEFSIYNPDEQEGEPIKTKTEENDLGKGDGEGQIKPQTQENDITGASTTSTVVETSNIPAPVVDETTKTEEVTKTPEEISEALSKQSVAEIKVILASFPEEETKELKNKEQYIAYLVTKLSTPVVS